MEPVVAPRTFSGRYEVTHLIARGGMAQVYRALDTRLGRHVALKVLFPELSIDRAFVERFRREAQAAANLSHPNIVAVYDWGEDEGSHFIAMELVTGTSLATALRAERTLPATRAATIAAEVASALAYAHRHGVVHRDIKPGNVLLTDEGQVKVTDFGIAQAVSTEEGLTMAGSVMGTAAYFSPEQAEGVVVDGRSDLFSLGVVLFEMLAGRTPFVGDSPVAVASMHVRNAPPMLRDLSPAVPEALERITMHALEKAPADRYQSAEDLRADLLRFTEGQPVLATAAASAAAVLSTSVMGATATSTLPARDTTLVVPAVVPVAAPPTSPPPPAPRDEGGDDDADAVMRRPPSARTTWIVLGLVAALVIVGLLAPERLRHASTITIPNLAGQTADAAATTLSNEGLKPLRHLEPDANPAYQANVVIRTVPPANTPVAPGSEVTLVISSGPPAMVQVPNVVGQPLSSATAALHQVKLNWTPRYVAVWHNPVIPGSVLAQSIGPGTKVTSGTSVTLTLLTSTGQFGLPDVRGMSQVAAASTLGSYGLRVGSQTTACSNGYAVHLVAATSPPPGTLVTGNAPVALTVSSGPCPVQVPNVITYTVQQATNAISSAGLSPQPNTSCPPGETSTGTVVSQNPTGGTMVKLGSPVTFNVGCVAGNSGAQGNNNGNDGVPPGHQRGHGHATG